MRQDLPGIYDLSDHSSLVVGGRERGMGLAVPKEGNIMTTSTTANLEAALPMQSKGNNYSKSQRE